MNVPGDDRIRDSIFTDAEEVVDPLANLVELAQADPGRPFTPDCLVALCELREADPPAFERLRASLKQDTKVRVTELDDAMRRQSGESEGRHGRKQADVLIQLAAGATLFHSPDGLAYAQIEVGGHNETRLIRGTGFKRWLTRLYFVETGGAPNSEAIQAALGVLEARAHYDGDTRNVFLRVGGYEGKIYLDLVDADWRVVEIDEHGWRLIDSAPVHFRRTAGMLPLPVPVEGGSVEELRRYLNLRKPEEFVLVVAWMLAAFRDRGPYPVAVLVGEQGSAKSTFSAICRKAIDPNTAPLRALPREDRDLFIAANNGYVLIFDNVSGLPGWLSDTLCRLATGGGFAVRRLYSDDDEVLFEATRPVVLNGIEDFVTRPDLADRAVMFTLEPIPEDKRRTETDLWASFDADHPRILGALLSAVSHGLRHLGDTHLPALPRMADFALWASACEGALWEPGTFMRAYQGAIDDAIDNVIESDPVASAVRDLIRRTVRTVWTGSSTDLLEALNDSVREPIRAAKNWPKTPRALSGQLRRAATFLRKSGIDIEFEREGRSRTRTIRILPQPDSCAEQPSAPSAPSASFGTAMSGNGLPDVEVRTVGAVGRGSDRPPTVRVPNAADGTDRADANEGPYRPPTVRGKSLDSNAADDADGADANLPGDSAGWSTRV